MKIIIVHRGNQRYLHTCISQAQKNGNDVVLIGDKSNAHYSNWVDASCLLTDRLEQFNRVYKHMSPNRFNFEKICFERYFLIWKYMKDNKLSKCIMMDSDVLLYTNIDMLDFTKYSFAASYEERYECTSPHFSYWTYEAIDAFTQFIIDIYENEINLLEEKWNRHISNHIPGGICDMTLLYHYVNRNKDKFLNIESLDSIKHFDGMIDNQLDEEYFGDIKMTKNEKFAIRLLEKKEKNMYFLSESGERYKILSIHAQGISKQYMDALAGYHTDRVFMMISKFIFWIEKAWLKVKRKIFITERYN